MSSRASGAGFIVRGGNGKPIGCVIGARGSPLSFTAWGRTRIGDFSSAEWAFRRGLADHPRDTALHRQYSWMLAARGDTAASRREASRASGQQPTGGS